MELPTLTDAQIEEALKGSKYEINRNTEDPSWTIAQQKNYALKEVEDRGLRWCVSNAEENAARAILLQRKLDAAELKVDRAMQSAKDLASLFNEAHTSRVSYASIVEGLARVTRALAELKG